MHLNSSGTPYSPELSGNLHKPSDPVHERIGHNAWIKLAYYFEHEKVMLESKSLSKWVRK